MGFADFMYSKKFPLTFFECAVTQGAASSAPTITHLEMPLLNPLESRPHPPF